MSGGAGKWSITKLCTRKEGILWYSHPHPSRIAQNESLDPRKGRVCLVYSGGECLVLSGACPALPAYDVSVQCTTSTCSAQCHETYFLSHVHSSIRPGHLAQNMHRVLSSRAPRGRDLDTRITAARTLPETLRECADLTQEWNLVANAQLLAYQIAPPVMERSCPAMPFAPSLHR